jgi:formylglycine-generating enzyme required for sulfatase activity
MRSIQFLCLFFLFGHINPAISQILRERPGSGKTEQKPAKPSQPDQKSTESRTPVTPKPVELVYNATLEISWNEDRAVLLVVNNKEYPLRAGSTIEVQALADKALDLKVKTPAGDLLPEEFIFPEKGHSYLSLKQGAGNTLNVFLQSENQKQESENQRAAEAARKREAENQRSIEEARKLAERLAAERADAEAFANEEKQRPFKELSRNMVFIEGGSFEMGCIEIDYDCLENELPTHTVSISSFYISKYEVTQVLWAAVIGNNPSNFQGCPNCPVELVSWEGVQVFLKELNSITGKQYRLPTEAEWEYAARGGNKSQHTRYPGGNKLGSVAWYLDNSGNTTHPVGEKQPNELGLYDMSGNVCEWVSDWYGRKFYRGSPVNNPTGPALGSTRVIRGGSWKSNWLACHVPLRIDIPPDNGGNFIGFRIVSSEKP